MFTNQLKKQTGHVSCNRVAYSGSVLYVFVLSPNCARTHIILIQQSHYTIYYFACSHSPDVRTAAAAQGYLAISGLTWRCGQLGGDVMLLMRASATSTGKRSIEDVRRGQDTVPRRTVKERVGGEHG